MRLRALSFQDCLHGAQARTTPPTAVDPDIFLANILCHGKTSTSLSGETLGWLAAHSDAVPFKYLLSKVLCLLQPSQAFTRVHVLVSLKTAGTARPVCLNI